MFNTVFSIFAIPLLFIATIALAENMPQVTVEEVISSALERSPLAKEIEARAVARKAEGLSIKTLENPELDAELKAPVAYSNGRGDNQIDVSLSQRIRPSDFGIRDRVNALLSEAGNHDRAIGLVELTQSLRLLYMKAWASQEQLKQIRSGRDQAKKLSQLIKAGALQALYGPADSALVEAEEKKLLAEQIGLESDLDRTKAEIIRKSGVTLQTGTLAKPSFLPVDASSLLEVNLPIFQRAQALVRLSAEQEKLARLDSYPRFAPRLVYSRNEEGTSYVGAGISFDLPFFNTNQAEKLKTAADTSAARGLADYLAGPRFQEEIKLLSTSLDASKKQAQIYEQEVIPAIKRSFEAYEATFKRGQGSAFQLFQMLGDLTAAKTRGLELWVKIQSERSELSVLVGKDI